jgi:hypothetical protein
MSLDTNTRLSTISATGDPDEMIVRTLPFELLRAQIETAHCRASFEPNRKPTTFFVAVS